MTDAPRLAAQSDALVATLRDRSAGLEETEQAVKRLVGEVAFLLGQSRSPADRHLVALATRSRTAISAAREVVRAAADRADDFRAEHL